VQRRLDAVEAHREAGGDVQARVHRPALRFHGTPKKVDVWSNAQEIGTPGLLDYVADLEALVATMETPTIIVGRTPSARCSRNCSPPVSRIVPSSSSAPRPRGGSSTWI
jgi:hypothetical protein